MGEVFRFNFRGGKVMDLADWLVVILAFFTAVGMLWIIYSLCLGMGY